MPSKLSEKKKYKRIRLLSSSSDKEESSIQIDPGHESSDTLPIQKRRTCNLDDVVVACDRSEINEASSTDEYCIDKIGNSCTDVLFPSNSSNSSKTNPVVREFGPDVNMFTNVSASIIVQIEKMHYYLRSMLKEKLRQEEDVAEFKTLQIKLGRLGKPMKERTISLIKNEFKEKAKTMGAKFIRCLIQAMSQFNDKKSYLTLIFVKTLKLFSLNNNMPSPKFIIKCRLAIQGMLELNGSRKYLFNFFFIEMEEKDFISIVEKAWSILSLVSDVEKYEIDLSD